MQPEAENSRRRMKQLSIDAASPESARAMIAALSDFKAELREGPRGDQVVVELDGDHTEIVGVLNALQQYVTERAGGPARVELGGKQYAMHPEPECADRQLPRA